ncbi:MAG: hypothetical protein KBF12_02830 [Sebaldella sp.]|nr:hypothetical protein [Sebaldella sp.]
MIIFDKIFDYLLDVEGGYSNSKYDKGGKTTWGITEERARQCGYKGDMRYLSKEIAKDIYRKKYYLSNNIDKIKDDRVALSICDWLVNSGTWGTKKAQRTVNEILGKQVLVEDGIIGVNSIKYINQVNADDFLKVYHALQRKYYHDIAKGNQIKNLQGWLNRVTKKEKYIKNNF